MNSLWHKFRSKLFLRGEALIEKGTPWLAPLSWGWGTFAFCKNALYDLCLLKPKRIPCAIVSVGNLVAGGTGKTPLAHLLARTFSHRKVAILSRGYGAIPDEARLLKRRLPGVEVYIGKDRVALAQRAVAEGAELLLLDDGFQYRKLHRDFDLVLLFGEDPFGKGHFLPRGYLRESPRGLLRADLIIATGKSSPFTKITCTLEVGRILDFQGREIPTLEGWKVGLFSGIARPASFKKTILSLGASAIAEWVLADHEEPSSEDLLAFTRQCQEKGAQALVCTEKDVVKLPLSLSLPIPLLFLEMNMEFQEGREEWEKLIAKIDQKIDDIHHGRGRSKNSLTKARGEHCQRPGSSVV